MSGNLDLKFTADENDLYKGQAKLIKQQEEMITKLKNLGKEGKASTKELDRFAASTTKINQTPLQKYADQMQKLDAALKAGKISQETFNRAVAQAKTHLEQAGSAGRTSFGATAITSLKTYAAGMVSLGSAAAFFGAAMEAAHQKTVGAMAAVDGLVESRRRLRQVSDGGADNQVANKQADELAVAYGITREESRNLLFSARSEGFLPAAPSIAKLGGAGLVETAAAARVAGQVPGLFGGKVSPMGAVAGTLYAAKQSRLDFEQIATNLPVAAEGASLAGADAGETLALLSSLAGKTASGETAASKIKSFGATIGTSEEFKGRGIIATVEALQARPEEDRREFLGTNQELNAAYSMLSELLPTIRERHAGAERVLLEADRPGGMLATQTEAALDTNTHEGRLNQSRMQNTQEKNRLAIQREEQLAIGGYERNTATTRTTRNLEAKPFAGPLQEYAAAKLMGWAESGGASPANIQRLGQLPQFTGFGMAETVLLKLGAVADRLMGAAASQERAAGTQQHAADAMGRVTPEYSRAAAMRASANLPSE